MALPYEDEKLTSQNPFVDLLIYNLKFIAYNVVLKDEYRANLEETVESLRNGYLYISCVENHVELDMFQGQTFPRDLLIEAGLSDEQVWLYENFKDRFYIPDEYREKLTELLRQWYMDIYLEEKELNPYYRKLVGLPPSIDAWGVPIREFEYLLPEGIDYDKNCVYFHELSNDVIKDIEEAGVLDIILAEYPDHDYLRYKLFDIDIYDARKKMDMQVLYMPDCDYAVQEEFNTRLLQNRKFMLEHVYTYSMEIFQDNYHDVMMVFLLISVIVDILCSVQEHIIRKDILDRRCIQFIFSMYGIPYYKVIPLEYQERLCRNVNSLIKYKSSTTEMLNLLTIFDPRDRYNINIMKYYLLKPRKQDAWGNFVWASKRVLKGNYNDIVEETHLTEDLSVESEEQPVPDEWELYDKIYGMITGNNTEDDVDTQFLRMYSYKDHTPDNSDSDIVQEELIETLNDPDKYIHVLADTTGTDDTGSYVERYVKFPFDYFLQKGNVMFVRVDGRVLQENVDYKIVNYNKIRFYNGCVDEKKEVIYDFYYDKTTIDNPYEAIKDNAIQTVCKYYDNPSYIIDLNPVPFIDYFENGNQIIVSIGGVWLHPDMYSVDRDHYLSIADSIDLTDRRVTVIYIYGKQMKTCFEKHIVKATEDKQTRFTVPEPFKWYCKNGNDFFVNIGTTYLSNDRYQIHVSETPGNTYIEFTDSLINIKKDDSLVFNFLYSANSYVSDMEIKTDIITLTAEKDYQTSFNVSLPVPHYISCRYRYYVRYAGGYLPEDWYTLTEKNLTIINESLALHIGDQLELVLVYIDTDRTEEKYSNIKVKTISLVATADETDRFSVVFPVSNYNTKNNRIVVDIEGKLLIEGEDYKINYLGSNIRLLKHNLFMSNGMKINITFYYNTDPEYVLNFKLQDIPINNKENPTFELDYPFYPYLDTGQDFIAIMGSLVLDRNRTEFVDPFTIKLNTEDIPLTNIARSITVLYIYNTWYIDNGVPKLIVEWNQIQANPGSFPYLSVPVPFQYYIENGWDYFVTYGDRQFLPEDKYDIFNSSFYTNPPEDLKNKTYGQYITFTFIYLMKEPYVYYDTIEDYQNTTDLYFCRIPIDELYAGPYIRDKSNWKEYDPFVRGDGWWDGKYYKQNNHELLKQQIYEEKWNYARSKYYQVVQTIDIAAYSVQLSYFYSMLYDDVLLEEQLLIRVPSLSNSHRFKLAHLFIFMTVLTYIYNGMEDFVIDDPYKTLYVQGFNFHTSLDTIKEYLRVHHREKSEFPIWDFIRPESQIPDMDSFVNIYKTNIEVRRTICQHMLDSEDYEEYQVWKDIYEALMNWKLTMTYFTLSNGKIATTYTEFLQDKDMVLYNLIKKVEAIANDEEREDTIVQYIDDIIYILDEWLGEFQYIFDRFAGHSGTELMQYIRLMIEFFKSYKIVFKTNATILDLSWGADRDEDLTMRPIDCMHTHMTATHNEYVVLVQTTNTAEHDILEEKEPFLREDIVITKKYPPMHYVDKYINGTLELSKSGDIEADLDSSIEVQAAQPKDITFNILDCSVIVPDESSILYVEQPANGRIEVTYTDADGVYHEKEVATEYKLKPDTEAKIEAIADDGYLVGGLYVGEDKKDGT